MNIERFQNITEEPKDLGLNFEVRQYKEGVVLYVFKNLAVAIDTTGKNYKAFPELIFGPYDNALDIGSLKQPEKPNSDLNMEYVSECIKKVALASGIHQFWFYPFGDDSPTENKERREQARMKLFEKTWATNIHPAPEGHGYILTL